MAKPCEVILVGAGRRAAAWFAQQRGSARLRIVASVARGGDPVAPDLPCYATLAEAAQHHATAGFAVALPPRAGLDAALELAAAGRSAVLEAPLHEALADAELGPGADAIRVAHGWVTLSGVRAVEAVMRRAGGGHLSIEIAGLPEEESADLREGIVHALALVHTLLPEAQPAAARLLDGGMEVELRAAHGWTAQLRLRLRGRRLAVRVEASAETAHWTWEDDRERVMLGERTLVAPRATAPAAARALAQLLPGAARGDGLAEAAAVLHLARAALSLLPTALTPGSRAFRQAASIAARRPTDLLAGLGLRGALPASHSTAPVEVPPALPPEPFELWAFRAGIKPVVFLTVRPDDVERTLAWFGDAHCERRERRVQVDAQDRWTDRRDRGEPRVELYIARDAGLARAMADRQTEQDPSAAVRELGELAGYPPCCVDAFARQDDRANNSRNRYHSHARTLAPDGSTATPWPWELNNLHVMTVPFYPCSYRCQPALTWARASLAEMARAHPVVAERLRAYLSRPVLYFDHDHQLILDGDCTIEHSAIAVTYAHVSLPAGSSEAFTDLAAGLADGDRLRLDDQALVVEKGGREVLRLRRSDPALGLVAPFGVVPQR